MLNILQIDETMCTSSVMLWTFFLMKVDFLQLDFFN